MFAGYLKVRRAKPTQRQLRAPAGIMIFGPQLFHKNDWNLTFLHILFVIESHTQKEVSKFTPFLFAFSLLLFLKHAALSHVRLQKLPKIT